MASRATRLMQYAASSGLQAVLNSRLPNCGEGIARMCEVGMKSVIDNRQGVAHAAKLVPMKQEALQSIRFPKRTFR